MAVSGENAAITLKDEVREIVRAYRHIWDVYSELMQNSVDAINRKVKILRDPEQFSDKNLIKNKNLREQNFDIGRIELEIFIKERRIILRDNGVGIARHDLDDILLPRRSRKKISRDYGFKGIGLTFITFVSREFKITSREIDETTAFSYTLSSAFDWIADDNGKISFPQTSVEPELSQLNEQWNTEIDVRFDNEYTARFGAAASLDKLFNLCCEESHLDRFEYILRSKTALGNTKSLFGDSPIIPIEVMIKIWTSNQDKPLERQVNYCYYHPKDHKEVSIDTYDFQDYISQLQKASFDRTFRCLTHKILNQKVGTRNIIKFDVFLAAVSSTRLGNIDSNLKLDDLDTPDLKIDYGIYLAINGMPTGIRIDDWDRRGSVFSRFFVIVDCDLSVSNYLDPGRKGISYHYALLIRNKVEKLLSVKIENSDTFLTYARKHLDIGRGKSGFSPSDFQSEVASAKSLKRDHEQNDSKTLELVTSFSPLGKIPSSEQEVIVLFYSLLSQHIIKGYKVLYQGGANVVYDAAFEYSIELVAENSVPTDPLGISQRLVDEYQKAGLKIYHHKDNYSRWTALPELCIEFKKSLSDFLQEIEGRTNKDSVVIDLIICWDVEIPETSSLRHSLDTLPDRQRLYHGTTHKLGITGATNSDIQIISLKEVLQRKIHYSNQSVVR
ncbi:MAG: ATP-binding protein [Cyanobacteria bacterium P01_E01_bin.42]